MNSNEISIGGLKEFKFDIDDPLFYNENALIEEAKRVYSKCKDCRMCVNFCPSFPALFDAIDKKEDNIEALTKEELFKPLELCFHCKQCFFKCPYTPPHEWKLDFPHLSLRYKAFKYKNKGALITDKLILNTDLIGKLSVPFSPIVNKVNGLKAARVIFEKVLKIDKRAKLPPINSKTFSSESKSHIKSYKEKTTRVVLFYSCLLEYNFLEKGKALLKIFEKNNIELEIPNQNCCGIPFFDIGDLDSAAKKARENVKNLIWYAKNGYDIVVPVPTCALQIKYEYPLLLKDEEAKIVADKVIEVSEFLYKLHQEGKFNKNFTKSFGNIDYHIACHLKALGVGQRAAALMRLIPNTKVKLLDKCSGHDGTFGVKVETFDYAVKVGQQLFDNVKASENITVSDCPLAANFIELNTGKKVYSPLEILAMAYGD